MPRQRSLSLNTKSRMIIPLKTNITYGALYSRNGLDDTYDARTPSLRMHRVCHCLNLTVTLYWHLEPDAEHQGYTLRTLVSSDDRQEYME